MAHLFSLVDGHIFDDFLSLHYAFDLLRRKKLQYCKKHLNSLLAIRVDAIFVGDYGVCPTVLL
jgi:hypothetical protein